MSLKGLLWSTNEIGWEVVVCGDGARGGGGGGGGVCVPLFVVFFPSVVPAPFFCLLMVVPCVSRKVLWR